MKIRLSLKHSSRLILEKKKSLISRAINVISSNSHPKNGEFPQRTSLNFFFLTGLRESPSCC